jgi:hypothetical protein
VKFDIKNVVKVFPTNINTHYPYTKDLLYSDEPLSKLSRLDKSNIDQKKLNGYDNPKILNELNDLNYRCDNFTNNHLGQHILFAGCSVTFGSGLEVEEIWSKKVYNLISGNNACSGYFNLAVPGSSVINQIALLFKYFKIYGNPDVIFLNSPGLVRFYSYSATEDLFFDSFYSNDSKNITNLISYQYYLMLDQYCNSNNIKLYSFTWKDNKDTEGKLFSEIEDTFSVFNSFYLIDNDELSEYCAQYVLDNKGKSFLIKARDKDHHGIAFHDYWANFIYEKYLNDNSWN